jgi:opacity protein-like surface antigen
MAIPRSAHLAASLSRLANLSVVLLVVNVALSKSAGAQLFANAQQYGYEVSGHVGIQFPLATFTSAPGASSPTTIGDHFNMNFPFGLGVKPNWSPVLVDFEFVPEVHNTGPTTFLVHPGVIMPLPDGWAVGVRGAYEVAQNSKGFTPLVNKGFPLGNVRWFVEGDLPVRFTQLGNGASATSVGFAIHTGLAF